MRGSYGRSGPRAPKNSGSSSRNLFLFAMVIVAVWLGVLFYYASVSKKKIEVQYTSDSSSSAPAGANVDGLQTTFDEYPSKQQHSIPIVTAHADKASAQPSLEDEGVHVVFSTDCSFYQDWQSLTVFHSAQVVSQKGKITRIASGCTDVKQQELRDLYKTLFPQYDVHFTPNFKIDKKTKKSYDFYNKPYGVQHWLEHAEPPVRSGTVIGLIDPDFIFLRPLTSQIAGSSNILFLPHFKPSSVLVADPSGDPSKARFTGQGGVVPDRVRKGVAAAELYGLGAPWTYDNHKNFNRTAICGANSPCMKVSTGFGQDHYSVGPPYMLERDDLLSLTNSWTEFVPRVYEKYPNLLAEMFAYSMAAAHAELPHFTMLQHMVSNTFVTEEGWKWIDQLQDDVCLPPISSSSSSGSSSAQKLSAETVKPTDFGGIYYPGKEMPTFLHFCQFFRAGELGFQKRRIRKQIFECDSPLMAEPPMDLGKVNYKNRDGEIVKLGRMQARRNAFMLCVIHRSINAMLMYVKTKTCPPGSVNFNKTINVVAKGSW